MKNLSHQGARRSAYVDTYKSATPSGRIFHALPQGLEPEEAARGVANARKASSLAALGVLRSASSGSNAISLHRVNRT